MVLEVFFDGNKVSHPLGWQGLSLTLERHKDFHGIIEYVDSEFIWIDTAADYILDKFHNEGFGAIINVSVLLNVNDTSITIYSGILDLKLIEIIHIGKPLKVKCPIISNSTWSKLIASKDTKLNLLSDRTLSGNSISTLDTTVTLSPQTIISKFRLAEKLDGTLNDTLVSNPMYLIHHFTPELSNIERVEDYGTQVSSENPLEVKKYFLKAKYKGSYTFNYRSAVSIATNFNFQVIWYYAVNSNAVQIGSGNGVTVLSEIVLEKIFDHTFTVNLEEGDEVYFYGVLERTSGTNTTIYRYNSHIIVPPNVYIPEGLTVYSNVAVDAQTTFDSTQARGLIYSDAIKKAIQIVTDTLPSVSLPLKIFLTSGKLIRGLQSVVNSSINELIINYSTISPIGIDDNGGSITVLTVDNFYLDEDGPELIISDNYVIKPDVRKLVKSIEIGYSKFESETAYGVNDIHGSHLWVNQLPFGEDAKLICSFIASAISIEETRRRSIEGDKDWRLDEENFVIVLKADNTPEKALESGISFSPSLQDHYNTRIAPGENLNRNADLYSTEQLTYRLVTYKGARRTIENDYESLNYITCILVEAEAPMDLEIYNQIKQNKYKRLLLSTGTQILRIYIEKIEYGIFAGKAKISGYVAVGEEFGFSEGFTKGFDA